MTSTPTTAPLRQGLAEVETGFRNLATEQGRPLERGSWSPFHLPGLTSNPLVVTADRKGAPRSGGTALTVSTVLGAMDNLRSIVAADRNSLTRVASYFAAHGTDDGNRVSRRIRAALSLHTPTSILPVADSLAFLYWFGAETDPRSLKDWGKAFGVRASGTDLLLARLLPRLSSGQGVVSGALSVKLASIETSMLQAADYPGLSAACSIYDRMNRHKNTLEGYTSADPARYAVNTAQGTISPLRLAADFSDRLRVRIEGSLKYKPGSSVRIIGGALRPSGSPELSVDSFIDDVSYSDDGYDVVLAGMPARALREVKSTSEPMYLAPTVFAGMSRKKTSGKWFSRQAPDSERTQTVPLDVVLAGGPIDQSA